MTPKKVEARRRKNGALQAKLGTEPTQSGPFRSLAASSPWVGNFLLNLAEDEAARNPNKDLRVVVEADALLFVTTSWTFVYENSPIITDFSLSSKPYFHWSYVILVVKKLSLKPSRAIMEAWLLQFEPRRV